MNLYLVSLTDYSVPRRTFDALILAHTEEQAHGVALCEFHGNYTIEEPRPAPPKRTRLDAYNADEYDGFYSCTACKTPSYHDSCRYCAALARWRVK